MKYYRVRPEYDQHHKNTRIRDGNIYIGGELYTPTEVKQQGLDLNCLQRVEVSRKSVYWFFGARFSTEIEQEKWDV